MPGSLVVDCRAVPRASARCRPGGPPAELFSCQALVRGVPDAAIPVRAGFHAAACGGVVVCRVCVREGRSCGSAARDRLRHMTTQIYEGTNQIQRIVMARALL